MNDQSYFMSVDIGTQGTKASLVSAEGAIKANSFIPSRLIHLTGGGIEQNPSDIMNSVIEAIQNTIEKSGVDSHQVLAIGMNGQMAGVMGIDRQWNPVTNYDSWLDTRCELYITRMKTWGEEEMIRLTGSPVSYAHGPKILWWKHERPEIYSRIDKFVVLTTYVAGELAGLTADQAYIDYTHLHFSGFADVVNKEWSDFLLDQFGVRKEQMPRIVSPWEVIGYLRDDYAIQCGLRAGIPIVAGSGDTSAATLGAGIIEKGTILDVAGTASILTFCTDKYRPDTETKTFIYARSILDGLWTPLAYINGGGECLAWFKSQIGAAEAPLTFDQWNVGASLTEPGSRGLYFVPHFGGRVCPNNSLLRGSWIGLHWAHTKFDMYRSVMEAIAYEYKYFLDTMESLLDNREFQGITGVGGGAKSELFNGIKADVLGLPYTPLSFTEPSILANAAVAGYGIGFYSDIGQTVQGFISRDQTVMPNEARQVFYSEKAESYKNILVKMTELYGELRR